MWLAPAVAPVDLFAPTVFAEGTEGCCGCVDCNDNGVDDRSDLACSNGGTFCDGTPPQAASAVCNSGYFPSCATSLDCNANGIPDECDIAGGTSCDANLDTVPDECQFQIPANVLFVEDDAPPGGDGLDNDCDCATDCEEEGNLCLGKVAEDCRDSVDNDCDGDIDCADSDCAFSPFCGG